MTIATPAPGTAAAVVAARPRVTATLDTSTVVVRLGNLTEVLLDLARAIPADDWARLGDLARDPEHRGSAVLHAARLAHTIPVQDAVTATVGGLDALALLDDLTAAADLVA